MIKLVCCHDWIATWLELFDVSVPNLTTEGDIKRGHDNSGGGELLVLGLKCNAEIV